MVQLLDLIASMAEALGSEMQQPQIIEAIMPALVEKWTSQIEDTAMMIGPLFECFTVLAQSLGRMFLPYAEGMLP